MVDGAALAVVHVLKPATEGSQSDRAVCGDLSMRCERHLSDVGLGWLSLPLHNHILLRDFCPSHERQPGNLAHLVHVDAENNFQIGETPLFKGFTKSTEQPDSRQRGKFQLFNCFWEKSAPELANSLTSLDFRAENRYT